MAPFSKRSISRQSAIEMGLSNVIKLFACHVRSIERNGLIFHAVCLDWLDFEWVDGDGTPMVDSILSAARVADVLFF